MRLAILVVVIPSEWFITGRGNAKRRSHHTVDFTHELLLLGTKGAHYFVIAETLEGSSQFTKDQSMLAQFEFEQAVKCR